MIKKQGVKYLKLKMLQNFENQEKTINDEIEKLNYEGKRVIHIQIQESYYALILYEQESI